MESSETYLQIKEQINMDTGETFILMKKSNFYYILLLLIATCFGILLAVYLIAKVI